VRGRRAELPNEDMLLADVGYRESETLTVALQLEDNPNYVIDFSLVQASSELRREMLSAIAAFSTSGRGPRRVISFRGVHNSMKSWFEWLSVDSDRVGTREVRRTADVTTFHVLQFRNHLNEKYAPSVAVRVFASFCNILACAADLTPSCRAELKKRRHYPSKKQFIERYSEKEFYEIRAEARKVVRRAHSRIHASYTEALSSRGSSGHDSPKARALYEVLTEGKPRDKSGFAALGALKDNYGLVGAARGHLFLTSDELVAAVVVLVCENGLNLSPVLTAKLPTEHEEGILQLDLDKPRRGTNERFWPEIFVDGPQDSRGATWLRMIVEATEPGRYNAAWNGMVDSTLLMRWDAQTHAPLRRSIGVRPVRPSWWRANESIHFRRLRRSVPGRGVAKEPTHHSDASYLYYIRTDPVALAEQQEKAARGIQTATDRARKQVGARMLDERESDEKNDALIVSCDDPSHNPITLAPCTTAFFSFLDCLDCSNAITVGRLLPRQVAAIRVLEELRDALGETWEKRFARRYYVLLAMLERHTTAERAAAEAAADAHVPLILAALRSEIPQ
jgi:hypothetical protein